MTTPARPDPEPQEYTRFSNALAKLRQEAARIEGLRNEARRALQGAKGRLKDEAGRVEEWEKQLADIKEAIELLESKDG